MNRVAVFAHYDKNKRIEDYVTFYLKELKKVVSSIVFVSDSEIPPEEQNKIKDIVDYSVCTPHGEYDFGSYKRGFFLAKEKGLLENCDELIFCNDSCYAPLYPFERMFSDMSSRNVDFWGITMNRYIFPHVQSYFVVFKPQVFNNLKFEEFIAGIKKEQDKRDVILNYEIGLSKHLQELGFSFEVYSKISKIKENVHVFHYKKSILADKIPTLKRNIILNKEIKHVIPFRIKELIKHTNYDYDLIRKDCVLNEVYVPLYKKLNYQFKRIRKSIIHIRLKERKIWLLGKCYNLGEKNAV